jgi:hypothetical protein
MQYARAQSTEGLGLPLLHGVLQSYLGAVSTSFGPLASQQVLMTVGSRGISLLPPEVDHSFLTEKKTGRSDSSLFTKLLRLTLFPLFSCIRLTFIEPIYHISLQINYPYRK